MIGERGLVVFIFVCVGLVVVGSFFSIYDEVAYLSAKRRIELNQLLGELPEEGLGNYGNQTQMIEIAHQYKYNMLIGSTISSAGFWLLSIGIILVGLFKQELSEKLRLVFCIGGLIILVLVAYGLYQITLELSIKAGIT